MLFSMIVISPFLFGSGIVEYTDKFANALNWALMPLVGLVMLMLKPSTDEIVVALRVLCLGTIVAIIHSLYYWDWVSGDTVELNSVGRQSIIFVFRVCVIVLVTLFICRRMQVISYYALTLVAIYTYQAPARSMIGFAVATILLVGSTIIFFVG